MSNVFKYRGSDIRAFRLIICDEQHIDAIKLWIVILLHVRVFSSVALVCTRSRFNLHSVNILHQAGYQTDIRNVSMGCISLFEDAIPVVALVFSYH